MLHQGLSPQLKDYGCNSVVMANAHIIIKQWQWHMEWWLAGENQRQSEKNLLHWHFIHHNSHLGLVVRSHHLS